MVIMVTEEEGIVDVIADTQVIDAMVIAGAPTIEGGFTNARIRTKSTR